MKRVLIAGLYHETHTFLEGRTPLGGFSVRQGSEILGGPDLNSPLGAAVLAGQRLGWQIVPTIDLRAMPGPLVTDEVVDCFWQSFTAVTQRCPLNTVHGLYLVLHGAMVAESMDDVEGELLERIRSLPGAADLPVVGVLDLHANFTQRMADLSDGLIAYRQNPHSDARNAAEDAVLLLDRLMRTGERPKTAWSQIPLMWPPTGTGTDFDPMRALESSARRLEQEVPGLLAVNVLAGFAFADVPETGVSFTALTRGDPAKALEALQRLGDLAWRQRHLGMPQDLTVEEALERAGGHERGPVILAEPSDNIGAGAPGDGVGLLRALVERRMTGSAVVINDPPAVAAARRCRRGQRFKLDVGGKGFSLGPGPLSLEVELVSTSDGRFTLENKESHLASMFGSQFEMGPCAVVRTDGITILLTSRKTPPFDLAQWRSQGIEPTALSAIVVKAAVAHRQAYDPIAVAHYSVETPGPCTGRLSTLPYKKVRRPIYPLDELTEIDGRRAG